MNCPACSDESTRVLESRDADSGEAVRRRRECTVCLARFTTFERVEESTLWVIKRSGRREPFDRAKLLRGLDRACAKRPVPAELVERVVFAVEAELRGQLRSEVASELIGEAALRELRRLDGVAFIRFASVYRQYDDVDEFQRELDLLDGARTHVR